jgi:hypothetical protein
MIEAEMRWEISSFFIHSHLKTYQMCSRFR